MARFAKEGTKTPNSIIDPSNKGRKRTATMHGYFSDYEKVYSDMLAHQNPADLALSCLPERRQQQFMLLRRQD